MKSLRYFILILFLAGCYADSAMIEYDNRKHEVRLGDNINKALPILQNIQRTVPANWLRPADQFLENGKKYYVKTKCERPKYFTNKEINSITR